MRQVALQNHLKPGNTEVPELAVAENPVGIFQGNDGDVVVQHHRVRRLDKPAILFLLLLPFIDVNIKV